MLGPVFYADLRGHSRRPRLILLRIGFLCILLCLFLLCYTGLPSSIRRKPSTILADFASQFVFFYMIGQFVFLMLIGPTYVASAIAEEKQRGTLDYLFSSNLTNYEIIVGKYFSRLLLLAQFVMIGLPVLALTQLIGGVSLELILGMLLGTLGCLASLTALSLFLSVISRNGRDALLRAFLLVIVLIVCWFVLYAFRNSTLLDDWFGAQHSGWVRGVTTQLLNLNPVFLAQLLREHLSVTGNIDGLPIRWFGLCMLYHLAFAGILIVLSMLVVRRRFLKQIDSTVKRDKQVQAYNKPAVWQVYPLYWKERYVHGGSWRLFGWVSWIRKNLLPSTSLHLVFGIVFFAAFCMGVFVLSLIPLSHLNSEPMRYVVIWVVSALIACSLLGALVRTTSSITVEKNRETWEALVASPVSTQDLILSRVYGGYLSARWLWLAGMMLLLVFSATSQFDYTYSYGRRESSFGVAMIFVVANIGYLLFALGLAAFFSLGSSSSIRNVMSALTVLLTLNLLPFVVQLFFRDTSSSHGMLAVIYFVTDPKSAVVILGLGGLAVLSVVLYYKMPRLRWLYDVVKGLGNLLLLNAILLLLLSSFTFAFGGYVPFERVVLFVAPLALDYTMLSEYIIPINHRYYNYYSDSGGIALFQLGSSVLFALAGFLLYWLSVRRLQRTCGRVEYSRLAGKQRRAKPLSPS